MGEHRRRFTGGKGAGRDKRITAKQFLGKVDGFKGYSNPVEFATYLDSLRDDEYDQCGEFFSAVNEGCKLSNVTKTHRDRARRLYLHPVPIRPKSDSGLKVILEAGMPRFIEDYINGRVEINFTFEELEDECRLT